jgi:hypothetical protein
MTVLVMSILTPSLRMPKCLYFGQCAIGKCAIKTQPIASAAQFAAQVVATQPAEAVNPTGAVRSVCPVRRVHPVH